ncbi:MAG: hypothetical protein ACI910_000552, partial [Oleispira sp.]
MSLFCDIAVLCFIIAFYPFGEIFLESSMAHASRKAVVERNTSE